MPVDMSLQCAIARQTNECGIDHIGQRELAPLSEWIAARDDNNEQVLPERELLESVGQRGD